MVSINRGDIFYIQPYYSVGSEQRAGRPAVVVSNDKNNESSSTVEVVYLTTQPKKDLPTHVRVLGTGRSSTALCEQVDTVDRQRIGGYCGSCTRQEMQALDISIMISLGLYDITAKQKTECSEASKRAPALMPQSETLEHQDSSELISTKAQLEMMKQMYSDLLKKYLENVTP